MDLQHLQLLEAVVESAFDAVVITTPELDEPGPRILYVNPAFTTMTGYTKEEVLGKTPRFLQGPQTDRAVLDRLRQNLSHGQPFVGETINYRKDGTPFVLEWRIDCVRDAAGQVTHWVSVQRDVTASRAAEQKIRGDLNFMAKLLGAYDRKSLLIGYEIHDGLMQLVIASRMNLEALLGQLDPADPSLPALRHCQDILSEAIQQGRQLIAELRGDAADISSLFEAVRELVTRTEQKLGIPIEWTLDVPYNVAPALRVTALRMMQEALTNIGRHSQATRVTLSITHNAKEMILDVSDNGVGFDVTAIPAEKFGVEGIFRRAEVFGGKATIDSSPGKGTRTHVVLPLHFPERN